MKEESTLFQNLEKLNDQVDKAIETINGQKKLLAEYEKENAELKTENRELKNFIDENENREKELCILCENLKAQIKKMKRCENCKHWVESFDEYCICSSCEQMSKWEKAE